MAFETKALLVAIGELIRSSKSAEEAFRRVAKVANTEGVILDPFEETDDANERKQKEYMNECER